MIKFSRIKSVVGRRLSVPWYPILFGAYPVLYLLSFNVGQVDPVAGVRALLVSIAFSGLCMFLLRLLLHDWYRAAFLTTLWSLLFFSYGHIYNLLVEKYPDFDPMPWMPLAVLILSLLAAWWAARPGIPFVGSAVSLNVIALGLVVMSVGQTGFWSRPRSAHFLGAENAPVQADLVRPETPPDVYYFILDSYARQDLLEQAYDFDNSRFIQDLEQRGFYVGRCSQSNYVRTELSVGSSLNMSHLQALDPAFVPDNIGRLVLWDALKHSAVRYNFESLEYKVVNFATGYAFVEMRDADLFLSPSPLSSGLTEFEALFLRTTLARHAEDLGWLDADAMLARNFRDRFNHVFDSVDDLARMPEPTFAYIHLISPHPPFVFGPDGEATHPAEFWNDKRLYPADLYARGYRNQIEYLNQKMLAAIDTILAESAAPPLIIIQGDHGPWLQPREKRLSILNAYFLPGHADLLYPVISPVNSFRLVFNAYFGGKYDMLADVSYYSPVPKLYEFTEVRNVCK
jgi:hypothetical protein